MQLMLLQNEGHINEMVKYLRTILKFQPFLIIELRKDTSMWLYILCTVVVLLIQLIQLLFNGILIISLQKLNNVIYLYSMIRILYLDIGEYNIIIHSPMSRYKIRIIECKYMTLFICNEIIIGSIDKLHRFVR